MATGCSTLGLLLWTLGCEPFYNPHPHSLGPTLEVALPSHGVTMFGIKHAVFWSVAPLTPLARALIFPHCSLHLCSVVGRVLLWSPCWPGTHRPVPSSASWVLELKACGTMPSLRTGLYLCFADNCPKRLKCCLLLGLPPPYGWWCWESMMYLFRGSPS